MKIKGVARVGAVTMRWPCRPTLTIDREGIRLEGSLQFELKRNEVKRLEYSGGFFSMGVQIAHSNPLVSPDIFFRCRYPLELLSAAKQLGYETISTRKALL